MKARPLRLKMGLCTECWREFDHQAATFAASHHLHLGVDRGLTGAEFAQAMWR